MIDGARDTLEYIGVGFTPARVFSLERPEASAKPLAHTTRRLWSLRVGDWRVVFALRETEIWILKIGHRRDVYAERRAGIDNWCDHHACDKDKDCCYRNSNGVVHH